jgi:hypothetical protein
MTPVAAAFNFRSSQAGPSDDEAVVAGLDAYCADAYPPHTCLMTSDGSGGVLYAILLPMQFGDGTPQMCNARIGNDGTDAYVYRWNGTDMTLLSGTPRRRRR